MVKLRETEGLIFKIKRFSVHDGPGIRTAVFLKGCSLNCVWCHSPEGITSDISIWYNQNICIGCGLCVKICPENALKLIEDIETFIQINRQTCKTSGDCVSICPTNAMQFTGSKSKVSEVIREIEKDSAYYLSSGGGVTLTGGEPLYQPHFSSEILEGCIKRKIHTALETSLFCERDVIKQISSLVNLFIIDLKLFDQSQHKSFTGRSNEIIKENFCYLAETGSEILVRIPLIKNITDTDDNKNSIINWVKQINDKIPVEFINFNPLAENNYKRLGIPFLLNDI